MSDPYEKDGDPPEPGRSARKVVAKANMSLIHEKFCTETTSRSRGACNMYMMLIKV